MDKFTKPQQEAIIKENINILINAGAGSGKTTVLINRIINKLKKGTKISQFLVLTFTSAAAQEMKDRILKELKKDESLKEQIPFVHISDIMTFDSYFLKILKQYSYKLNMSQNISIGDEIFLDKKLTETIDLIFKKKYNKLNKILKSKDDFENLKVKNFKSSCTLNEEESFFFLISEYTVFDDSTIRENFKKLYHDYINIMDKDNINKNITEDFIVEQFKNYEQYIFIQIGKIKNLSFSLDAYKKSSQSMKIIETYQEKLKDIILVQKYDDLIDVLEAFKLPSKTSSKLEELIEVKRIQENIKTTFENLKKILIHKYKSEILEQESMKYNLKLFIIDLLEEIEDEYLKVKKDNECFEFSDIMKFSLQILQEDEKIKNELKNKYTEILIDEYQDTNDFQNSFVNLIQNNNLYLVGDVKQSIYGFRNANPKNFKRLENNYTKSVDGHVINLLHNFRSREEVLISINKVFERLMTKQIGMIDYKQNQALIYGNKVYEQKENIDYSMEYIVYNKEDLKEVKRHYMEAFIIALDIKDKVESKIKVIKNGKLDFCTYGDFCILTKNKTHYDRFKEVFDYLRIPFNMQKEEVINNKENYELIVLLNILKLIDEQDKVSEVSVLRSFLFEAKEQEIYDYLQKNILGSNIQKLQDKIIKIRKMKIRNLNVLLKIIYEEFSFFNEVIKIQNITNINERFLKINSVAKNLVENGKGIKELVDYLEYMFKTQNNQFEISGSPILGESVKLMTIHKSKGLEYPYVYVCQMNSALFKTTKELISLENGVLQMPFINNYVKEDSFLKKLTIKQSEHNVINENIRLLYVAMTRAKEKIIFIGEKNEENFKNFNVLDAKYFEDLLVFIRDNINRKQISSEYIKNFQYDNFINSLINQNHSKLKTNIAQNIEYSYYSLKINTKFKNLGIASKQTHEILTLEEKKNIEFGVELHVILERFDFKKLVDKEYVSDFLNSLDENKKEVIANILNDFQCIPFFNNIINVWNEYSFYYEDESEEINGVIDLLIERKEEVYIIDYKVKNINYNEYKEQVLMYKKAIEPYFKNKKVSCYLYSLLNNEFMEVVCKK